MELTILITVGVLFAFLGLVCVVTVVVGLPGAWMLLGLAVAVELADVLYLAPDRDETFGWTLLGACLALAVVGELLELAASALGAARAGSSRRGAIGSIIGGVVGAILGTGLPLPLLGTLVGAVVGTFAGAVLGELSGEGDSSVRDALRPASGATVGRVLGTLSKVPIAFAIWIVLTVAVFWP